MILMLANNEIKSCRYPSFFICNQLPELFFSIKDKTRGEICELYIFGMQEVFGRCPEWPIRLHGL